MRKAYTIDSGKVTISESPKFCTCIIAIDNGDVRTEVEITQNDFKELMSLSWTVNFTNPLIPDVDTKNEEPPF